MRARIGLALEDLPSRLSDTVGSLRYGWDIHTDGSTRQHDVRLFDGADLRHATLEVDVDVHDMTLTNGHDIVTRLVALLIFI